MVDISQNHRIFVDGVSVKELADQYSSPLYVYSEKAIRRNIQNLLKTAERYIPNFRLQYAIKANNNPHILKIIQEEGVGADCSSPIELKLAQKLGFDLAKSTYTGNYESESDFRSALEVPVNLNLDDYHRLPDVLNHGKPPVLSFRINPGIGRGGFEGIVTGGNDAKFGFPYEEVRSAYSRAKEAGIERLGIHMMTGSNILEPFYFAEITQKLMSIISEYLSDLGIRLEYINIGGGLGIPYEDSEAELDLEHTFKMVGEIVSKEVPKLNVGTPEIVMEPGRYLVGNAGVLLSQVTHVKRSYKNYLGIDAGMTNLLRPSLYKAFHRVQIDGKPNAGDENFFVCGQICENSDIFPRARQFLNPQKGDIAVIRDVGAYGYTMSSNYNNRTRPAEVLVRADGSPQLIREREQDTDLFLRIPEFDL